MTELKKRKRKGERKDGRFQVTMVIGFADSGAPIRKCFYGYSKAEAISKREAFRRQLEYGIVDDAQSLTVSEWIDRWFSEYRIDSKDSRNYIPYIHRLKRSIGQRRIQSILEVDLQKCLYDASGLSVSYLRKYNMVIRQIFSKAKKNKVIADDPSDDLILPVGTSGTHRALEPWEINLILSHWSGHRVGLWAMLMLLCGLRRGEMIALNWNNVDLVNRRITVCEAAQIRSNQSLIASHTKTEAGMRVIPICNPLYEALNSIPASHRSGLVCTGAYGSQITQSAFKRGWDSFNLFCEHILNGFPPSTQGHRSDLAHPEWKRFSIRAHDLRHTFATALYDAGVSVKAAQYYLGHSDVKLTLNLYTHLSQSREQADRDQLTGFLNDWHNIASPIGHEP